MKKIIQLIIFGLITNFTFSQTQQDFFNQSDEFFKNNVSLDGKIKYSGLKKSPGELLYIINNVSKLDIQPLANDTKIAFWINAYNLLVIRNVLDNYPVRSVNFITDFFDKKFQIANGEFTLNEIENILHDLIKDPASHFILCNGANGSSKLLNSAYLPETVRYQISYQMKSTINKLGFIKVNKDNKSVELPLVFEIHKKDFITQYYNQLDFLNVFLDKKLDNKLQITFAKFDLSLNEI